MHLQQGHRFARSRHAHSLLVVSPSLMPDAAACGEWHEPAPQPAAAWGCELPAPQPAAAWGWDKHAPQPAAAWGWGKRAPQLAAAAGSRRPRDRPPPALPHTDAVPELRCSLAEPLPAGISDCEYWITNTSAATTTCQPRACCENRHPDLNEPPYEHPTTADCEDGGAYCWDDPDTPSGKALPYCDGNPSSSCRVGEALPRGCAHAGTQPAQPPALPSHRAWGQLLHACTQPAQQLPSRCARSSS
jgi:hypothetical protein